LIKYLCSDETEDEDANEEYIEDTNRDAVMIAAAKLVLADTVSKVCAVFSSCDKVLKLCTSNYSCGNYNHFICKILVGFNWSLTSQVNFCCSSVCRIILVQRLFLTMYLTEQVQQR
jgi:hypothetical protein